MVWGAAIFAIALFGFLAVTRAVFFHTNASPQPPIQNTVYSGSPISGIKIPSVTLTDQNGQPFRLTDFKGNVVLLSFLDTHCTDICPITAQELVSAYKSLGDKAKDVASRSGFSF